MGRRWHPAGDAWLCNSPFEHHEFTQSRSHLARIQPILKGACEFWEARPLTTTVTHPATGAPKDVLSADSDWSPEHGPLDAGASHAVRGVGGRTTTVAYGDASRRITLAQGRSVILHDLGR